MLFHGFLAVFDKGYPKGSLHDLFLMRFWVYSGRNLIRNRNNIGTASILGPLGGLVLLQGWGLGLRASDSQGSGFSLMSCL